MLGSIWFFFWARNGGFHFRQGDWQDYKSTVLRRKGPNGTTLSGATKTTRLGGGSVVAEAERDLSEKAFKKGYQKNGRKAGKKVPRGSRNNGDEDVRAYRHEKSARVGGLNRESDGIFNQDFAYSDNTTTTATTTTYSDDVPQARHIPINTPKPKAAKKEAKWTKPTDKKRAPSTPSTPSPKKDKKKDFYTHTPTSTTSTDSHRPLRPNAAMPSRDSTPTRSRRSSPTKGHSRASVPSSFYTEPLDFNSRYSASNSDAGVTEDSRGTKAYFHPIPGLSGERSERSERASGGHGGFRRGMGRRDSLSDSEGETVRS